MYCVRGDPTFTAPLSTASQEDTLCFEVHGADVGEPRNYNLVSDKCVAVNARYVPRPRPPLRALNAIEEIGIVAVDSTDACVRIAVSVVGSDCSVTVRGNPLVEESYSANGISINRTPKLVTITVPNCDGESLVSSVRCEERHGYNMIAYKVPMGFEVPQTAHGLIGMSIDMGSMHLYIL